MIAHKRAPPSVVLFGLQTILSFVLFAVPSPTPHHLPQSVVPQHVRGRVGVGMVYRPSPHVMRCEVAEFAGTSHFLKPGFQHRNAVGAIPSL